MRAVRDDLPATPRNLEDLEFMNDDTQGFERAHRREMLIRLELAKAGIDFDKLPTELEHQLLRRRTPSTPALTTEIVAAINALETTGTNPW